jgi:hypothetical protein
MRRFTAAIAVVSGGLLAVPAAAQFGGIFGFPGQSQSPPPAAAPARPPAPVPGGRNAMPVPAAPAPGPGNVERPAGPYGTVQGQPLPPPGAGLEPPPLRGPAAPPSPQRAQRVVPPADATPQNNDEIVSDSLALRIVNNGALFTGLDKITGRIINFDVAVGETVQFGALQLTPRACYTRPATETAKPDAFVEVDEVTLQGEVRRIFSGWMYSASPGLHAVEHPIYDIWLTDCKSPTIAAERPAEPPAPAARAQQTAQPKQQQQQRRTTSPQQLSPQTLPPPFR